MFAHIECHRVAAMSKLSYLAVLALAYKTITKRLMSSIPH